MSNIFTYNDQSVYIIGLSQQLPNLSTCQTIPPVLGIQMYWESVSEIILHLAVTGESTEVNSSPFHTPAIWVSKMRSQLVLPARMHRAFEEGIVQDFFQRLKQASSNLKVTDHVLQISLSCFFSIKTSALFCIWSFFFHYTSHPLVL